MSINGKKAKASTDVKVNDEIMIRFGNRLLRAKVLIVPEKAVPAQQADTLYELLEETRLQQPTEGPIDVDDDEVS